MADNEIAPGIYREVDYDAGVVLYYTGSDDDVVLETVKVSDERLERLADSS